jgi:hypothetical protein
MQPPLRTGQLPLTQAVNRLVEMRVPGLIRQDTNDTSECAKLIAAKRAPLRRQGPLPTVSELVEGGQKREEDEKRLMELLRTVPIIQAKLASEREQAVADLAQALCDAAIQAWLICDATGDELLIPSKRFSTQPGIDALRTDRLTLTNAFEGQAAAVKSYVAAFERSMATFTGRVTLLTTDFERWAGSEAASADAVADSVPAPLPVIEPDAVVPPVEPQVSVVEIPSEWRTPLQDLVTKAKTADALLPRPEFLDAAQDRLPGCSYDAARALFAKYLRDAGVAGPEGRRSKRNKPKIALGVEILTAWMAEN